MFTWACVHCSSHVFRSSHFWNPSIVPPLTNQGALRKQREVYFPLLQTIVIPYMRLLVPTWTESLIVSAVEKPNKSSADEL